MRALTVELITTAENPSRDIQSLSMRYESDSHLAACIYLHTSRGCSEPETVAGPLKSHEQDCHATITLKDSTAQHSTGQHRTATLQGSTVQTDIDSTLICKRKERAELQTGSAVMLQNQ